MRAKVPPVSGYVSGDGRGDRACPNFEGRYLALAVICPSRMRRLKRNGVEMKTDTQNDIMSLKTLRIWLSSKSGL